MPKWTRTVIRGRAEYAYGEYEVRYAIGATNEGWVAYYQGRPITGKFKRTVRYAKEQCEAHDAN